MGCGSNIVPGFNESNKIKDPGLQMKMDQEMSREEKPIIKPSDIKKITQPAMQTSSRGYVPEPHIYQYRDYIIAKLGSDWEITKGSKIVRKKTGFKDYPEINIYGGELIYPHPLKGHPMSVSLKQSKEWLVNHVNKRQPR